MNLWDGLCKKSGENSLIQVKVAPAPFHCSRHRRWITALS
jgi:hypothetical protein